MKILSANQLKEVDKITTEIQNISSLELMERAAGACADWILKNYSNKKVFYVFCGPGNNGGDGLVIARILKSRLYSVTVFITSNIAYSDDFEQNFELWQRISGNTISINNESEFPNLNLENIIIIDALFGSGINRPIKGLAAELIHHINGAKKEVISIDIPSGLYVDNNATNLHNAIIKSSHTLTLEFPKLALILPENMDYSGEMHIIPIGLDKNAIEKQESKYEWITEEYFKDFLKKRNRFSH